MRILLVASDNNRFSGAFLSLVKLAELLVRKHGCKVIVLLPGKGSGKELLDMKHIQSVEILSEDWIVPLKKKMTFKQIVKKVSKSFATIFNVRKVINLIREYNIDIVHINTSYSYIGAMAACKAEIPFVWHIREFLEEDQEKQYFNKKISYHLMNKSSRIIAISNSINNKYASIFGDKLVTIHNGIEVNEYYCDRNIFTNNKIKILIVGGLNDKKGQWQAIRACQLLYSQGFTNIELNIVGKGNKEYTEKLHTLVDELGASKYIVFHGAQPNTMDYYKNSDIVLMCSAAEAFGRVTVEAMLSGALVIGAKSAGTCDIIQHGITGYLYQNENYVDLAEKLKVSLKNIEHSQKIAKDGQRYAVTNFNAEKNANQVYSVYQDVLNV